MNCSTEVVKKELPESDLKPESSAVKLAASTCNAATSASIEKDIKCEESHANDSKKDSPNSYIGKGHVQKEEDNKCEESHPNEFKEDSPNSDIGKGHIQKDASSSELSVRSDPLTSVHDDTLATTDSDSRASPVEESREKTSRPKSRKRKSRPLIPGNAKDWESNDSWTSEKAQEDCIVVAEEIETKRRKIKSLQQKNRRLKVRHSRLKAAIKEMKANMAEKIQ